MGIKISGKKYVRRIDGGKISGVCEVRRVALPSRGPRGRWRLSGGDGDGDEGICRDVS